jgi:hypothetical protein
MRQGRSHTEQDRPGAADHPARKRYLTEHLDPIVDQRIDIDVPVDLALEREPLASWYWGLGVGMGALPADD